MHFQAITIFLSLYVQKKCEGHFLFVLGNAKHDAVTYQHYHNYKKSYTKDKENDHKCSSSIVKVEGGVLTCCAAIIPNGPYMKKSFILIQKCFRY